jgi:hypothetical protein
MSQFKHHGQTTWAAALGTRAAALTIWGSSRATRRISRRPAALPSRLGLLAGGGCCGARETDVPVAPGGAPEAQPAQAEPRAPAAAVAPVPPEAVGEGEGVCVQARPVHPPARVRGAAAQAREGLGIEGGGPAGSAVQDSGPPLLPEAAGPAPPRARHPYPCLRAHRRTRSRVRTREVAGNADGQARWGLWLGKKRGALYFEGRERRERREGLPDDHPAGRAEAVTAAAVMARAGRGDHATGERDSPLPSIHPTLLSRRTQVQPP